MSQEKIAMVIILGSIGLMLLENVIGVDMYLIACIGAVLLVLTGVLSEKKHWIHPHANHFSVCRCACII